MKYTIDEFIAAAEQELAAWKCEGEKKRTDFDYEKLGFVRAVAKRLQDQQPVLPQADVMRGQSPEPATPPSHCSCGAEIPADDPYDGYCTDCG